VNPRIQKIIDVNMPWARLLPIVFLLTPDGKFVGGLSGPITSEEFEQLIKEIR